MARITAAQRKNAQRIVDVARRLPAGHPFDVSVPLAQLIVYGDVLAISKDAAAEYLSDHTVERIRQAAGAL